MSRYCRHCDQRFVVETPQAQCPQCGSSLEASHSDSTVVLDTVTFDPVIGAPTEVESAHDLVGKQLAQYQIERFLGQGGMARVYLAKHLTLERPCAIKVMRPSTLAQDEHAVSAFLAEARSAAALVHPHVVALHTIGHEHGRHYIEMEYVNGNSLSHLLEQRGRLDPLEATRFLLQISSALAAAHDLHMIHRDIKPANVMVTAAGDAKLADFGLAKRLATSHASTDGFLCGTPHYMAPELFANQPASPRSDIYAMGVTYFSLLTGRLPVDTQSLNELVQFHTKRQVIELETIAAEYPSGIIEILQSTLARDAAKRFGDAAELHRALRELFGSLRPLQMLLDEAFALHALEIVGADDRFTTRVPLDRGRFQSVDIEVMHDAETQEPIVRVSSICGRASDHYYERALQLNAAISHGSIGIQNVAGHPHFVMQNAYPRATCDPQEIRQSVLEIARHADDIERLLTREDRF